MPRSLNEVNKGQGMDKTVTNIHFKGVKDFRSRIAGLWQNQKVYETYDFTFENNETEKAFNELIECFTKYRPERSKREDHESGCGTLNSEYI